MIDGINNTTELVIGVCTALALLAGGYRVLWLGKKKSDGRREPGIVKAILRDARAARDSLLGRDAQYDTITGKEIQPALPGMGVRMAHQESAMELLTVTVTKLVDQQTAHLSLVKRVDGIEERVGALEEASVERVVTKAESAAAWRAIEAAVQATPDETPEQP